MGKYLGVTEVQKRGKKVSGFFSERQPIPHYQHRLIGVLNNGCWKIALDMTHAGIYEEAYATYARGMWLGCELYMLPESEVVNCPDEGRISMLG